MKEQDKICENCNKTYNENFYECPFCRTKNLNGNPKSINNPFNYLDLTRSVLVLLFGLIILYLVQILIQVITQTVLIQNGYDLGYIESFLLNGNFQFSASLVSYLLVIGSFIFITFPYLKYLKSFFKKWKEIIYTILLTVASILISLLYSYLIENFTFVKDSINENQSLIISAIQDNNALSFFSVVIFGPIAEEIVFRVGLFNSSKKFNKIAGYIITTVIFALLHVSFTGDLAVEFIYFPSYLILSLTLVFIYDKFGFENAIISHILNNLVSYIGVMVSIYG